MSRAVLLGEVEGIDTRSSGRESVEALSSLAVYAMQARRVGVVTYTDRRWEIVCKRCCRIRKVRRSAKGRNCERLGLQSRGRESLGLGNCSDVSQSRQ